MIAIGIALTALVAWSSIATLVVVARDGYRRIPTAEILR